MHPRKQAIKDLEQLGYVFKRHGARHDLYENPVTKHSIPIKRHDFDENDLRYIRKEAKQGR